MQSLRTIRIIPILWLAIAGSGAPNQDDAFRSPLDIPISLSGNFAEMRSNHFHTGLDIRTNGQTGYRVYAAADGWIARVAVSSGGYGHALYVNHPDGHQTVYAHLDRFEGPVADYVRSAQYAQRSFDVNLFPDEGRFPVRQGDVIALSGNSGSSGGPHLHFEIREAATARPLNPLLHGIPVDDSTPPRIYRIKLYPSGPGSLVRVLGAGGRVLDRAVDGGSVTVAVQSAGGSRYRLASCVRLEAAGRIGFGIQAHDYHERSSSRLGAYSIRLDAGERTVFESRMERLDFALNRYLNAHVDYAERSRNGRWIQRSYLLPGNRLEIYRTERDGRVDVGPGDELAMQYAVDDVFGNGVTLAFTVRGVEPGDPAPVDSSLVPVAWNRPTIIERAGLVVRIAEGSVYDDVALRVRTATRPAGALSPLFRIHDEDTPIHAPISISIAADSLPAGLRPFAIIARRTESGGLVSQGGSWFDGSVTTTTRTFGDFTIVADTIAPRIRPLNISDGASMASAASIRVRIADELSGVASYEGLVDGEWVLFAYDAKNSLIEYTFDGRVSRGAHVLEIRVRDGVGNVGSYRARFTR